MADFVSVRSGQSCPPNAIRAPDRNGSVVCLWEDREKGTFGRGDVDHFTSGLQAWFPWDGKEYDSKLLPHGFKVMVDCGQHRYAWLRVAKASREPHRFHPLEINGYSPCVIDGLLGKAKIHHLRGWTSWASRETYYEGDVISRSLVFCVLPKTSPVNLVCCYTGQSLPAAAIQAPGCRQGSYVALWEGKEQGVFGRASLNAHCCGLQAWFPYGGAEYDSQTIGPFQVACRNNDFDYTWETISKVKQNPHSFETYEVNGYCPAVVNGLLGKADIRRGMAWTSWAGKETHYADHSFNAAKVLCVRMKAD